MWQSNPHPSAILKLYFHIMDLALRGKRFAFVLWEYVNQLTNDVGSNPIEECPTIKKMSIKMSDRNRRTYIYICYHSQIAQQIQRHTNIELKYISAVTIKVKWKINGPKYHTAALDIILKKKTFCIDLGMSSHYSMAQIFYIRSQRSNLRTKTFSFFHTLSEILTSIRHCLTFFIHMVETGIESEIVAVAKV